MFASDVSAMVPPSPPWLHSLPSLAPGSLFLARAVGNPGWTRKELWDC